MEVNGQELSSTRTVGSACIVYKWIINPHIHVADKQSSHF